MNRLALEAGVGFGFWSTDGESHGIFGARVGVSGVLTFVEGGTIQNLGVTVGHQYHR